MGRVEGRESEGKGVAYRNSDVDCRCRFAGGATLEVERFAKNNIIYTFFRNEVFYRRFN